MRPIRSSFLTRCPACSTSIRRTSNALGVSGTGTSSRRNRRSAGSKRKGPNRMEKDWRTFGEVSKDSSFTTPVISSVQAGEGNWHSSNRLNERAKRQLEAGTEEAVVRKTIMLSLLCAVVVAIAWTRSDAYAPPNTSKAAPVCSARSLEGEYAFRVLGSTTGGETYGALGFLSFHDNQLN